MIMRMGRVMSQRVERQADNEDANEGSQDISHVHFVTYARYIILEELLSEGETWIQTG